MVCPPSRAAALARLDGFIPVAEPYARDRNHVIPGHPAVSRLSPAIRHRLLTEEEVVATVLRVHPFSQVEKFIQEVYWRRYWKSWLALHPDVWSEFLRDREAMEEHPTVRRIADAQSGNQVIDHFANELVTTGYLHNHARMWFAAWWVHEARLPWQAGAAFFFQHLLDGDPASNTLSWRWVAGLQTAGKTYLARRSNLEKYLAPELRDALSPGLAAFENPQPLTPQTTARRPVPRQECPPENVAITSVTGLWIHEEDLAVETSPLAQQPFAAIAVTADAESWNRHRFPSAKRQWITAALQDAAARAELIWRAPILLETQLPHADVLLGWAKSQRLQQVVTLRPEIGPLHDSLSSLRSALAQEGIRLALIDRPEDRRVRPFATGGFFSFWERIRQNLVTPSAANDFAEPKTLIEFRP